MVTAFVYWVMACVMIGFGASWIVLVVLLIPLGLIWFGDDLVVSQQSVRGYGTGWDTTPGCLVRAIGWALLLAPAAWWAVSMVRR